MTHFLAFELSADDRLEARRRAIFDSLTGFDLPSWAEMRAELGEAAQAALDRAGDRG